MQAIILGLSDPISFGTIKSLQMEKIPVKAFHKNNRFPYAKHLVKDSVFVDNDNQLLEELIKYEGIIFPMSDKYLSFCYENFDVLSKKFKIPNICGGNTKRFLDKKNNLKLNKVFLNPQTQYLSEELTIEGPLILKPKDSLEYTKKDIAFFSDKSELNNQKEKILEQYGEMIVQQKIKTGEHINIQGYKSSKGTIITMHKTLHILPSKLTSGPDVFCSSFEFVWMDDLVNSSKQFVEDMNLQGPVNFEIIKNNEGTYFIESNLRLSSNVILDTMSGVNLPAITYFDSLGKDITNLLKKPKLGMKFIHEDRELLYLSKHPTKIRDLGGKRVYANDMRSFGRKIFEDIKRMYF